MTFNRKAIPNPRGDRPQISPMERFSGTIIIPSPSFLSVASTLSGGALVALIAVFCFGSYAPRQTVSGTLVPLGGLITVSAQHPGIVTELLIHDGDLVEVGQKLATVSVEDSMADGLGAQSSIVETLVARQRNIDLQIRSSKALGESEEARLRARLAALHEERTNIRQQVSATEVEYQHAKSALDVIEAVRKEGYATELDVTLRRSRLFDMQQRLHDLARAVIDNDQSIRDNELESSQLPSKQLAALADLESSQLSLTSQIAETSIARRYAVLAPSTGRVTALQLHEGKTISASTSLMAIIPDGQPLVAELLVPTRAIGFISTGQEVRLRFRSYPYEHYGTYTGKLSSISRTALNPVEWDAGTKSEGEPVYRAIARLDAQTVNAAGVQGDLQSGMLLDADIVLGRRPVWRWIFEPLFAFRGRI